MITVSLLGALVAGWAASPVVIGVDTAGETLLEQYGIEYWRHEPFFAALDELGARFVVVHLPPAFGGGQDCAPVMQDRMLSIDAAMRAHGMTYALNLETPNFASCIEITPGRNEFEQPGNRHFWLLRPEWLQAVLDRGGAPALRALVYDEAEHMQLSNNKFADFPRDTYDVPFFVDTRGMGIEAAYDALVTECIRIREGHYGNRPALNTEQVWPDLFHIFARAGWTAAPKLLKEHFTPVVLCVALGAALQYKDNGARFWVSPDLWGFDKYPGHSPEALRSALLMGYWLGAECIYVENLDFDRWERRHPKADAHGSLVYWPSAERYELTSYGQVFKTFAKEYVPQHPRDTDWREYRPRVAIVRLPDGGWGQFGAGDGHGEAASRNRLLGNPEMPLDEPAREWLHVWSTLTHGVVKPGALSYNNPMVYPEFQDFFVPVDSVAVFDHRVTGAALDGVECIVVCGHALTAAAFDAVAQRVAEGAVCVIARRLYDAHVPSDTVPPGRWTVVDRFDGPEVADTLRPFLGPADEARYRFANGTVVFKKGAEPDRIETNGLEASGGRETVELDGEQRIESDCVWKGKRYRIRGDLVLASGTLTVEDAEVEILCEYARQYRIRWGGGTLVTKNAIIGGTKTDGVTQPTVFELYDGCWRAEDTTVQYSCGVVFSYATAGILDAAGLRAGENPDSVIVCGKAQVTLRDSVFDLALHLPGYGGAAATLDLPVKEPMTRVIDGAYVPGAGYRLELQNVTVPNVWFLFFVNVGNTGPETVYTLNRCPNIVPGLTATDLQGEARLPSSWSGTEWPGTWAPMPQGAEIAVGTLRVRTATDSTCLAGWGVYLDGANTDVTIAGSTALCELMVTGGKCRVLGGEGTHDIWVTCTTADAQQGARLELHNVNLAYHQPSPHYKQIRSSEGSTVLLDNVRFGDHLTLIADGGEIRVRTWQGNRAGVAERVTGGNIVWEVPE